MARLLSFAVLWAACTDGSATLRDAAPLDRPHDMPRHPPADGGLACGVCTGTYKPHGTATTVGPDALDEVSGVVESRRTPGILFLHNDSGDDPRFFALDTEGRKVGEYHLRGATAVDWEDLAIGPCPSGWCVYLGDLGDNRNERDERVIYRVREPAPTPDETLDVPWEALPFRFPDGRHDAETLLAHPVTGDLYVITKSDLESVVYVLRAPHTPGTVRTAERLATLTLPADSGRLVTAGDLHPCADRLLLRTYVRLYEYERPAGARFESIFTTPPRAVASLPERQGEAVGWRVDGSGYVTVSEGRHAPIHTFACAAP